MNAAYVIATSTRVELKESFGDINDSLFQKKEKKAKDASFFAEGEKKVSFVTDFDSCRKLRSILLAKKHNKRLIKFSFLWSRKCLTFVITFTQDSL